MTISADKVLAPRRHDEREDCVRRMLLALVQVGRGTPDVRKPASKSVVLKAGGTVAYYCRFHPNMTGSITASE